MRVTVLSKYSTFVNQLQNATSKLMELNMQSSSQKKINKPSDDPVGTARVLGYRESISSISQYQSNISTATGWLNLADNTLQSVSTTLTRIKGLAEQGATETMSSDNREQISYEVRQLFEQLIGLANTTYEGSSIFAGQKTGTSAYREAMTVTTNDTDLQDNLVTTVDGLSDRSILMQFTSDGTIGGSLATDVSYRYSTDGGKTFQNGTIAAGENSVLLNGVKVSFANGTTVKANSATDTNDSSGTWMWIRPTAVYQGDDSDNLPYSEGYVEKNVVEQYSSSSATIKATANGKFSSNVLVRVDNTSDVALDGEINYSYSTDGGLNWVTGNTTTGTASSATFVVPGGTMVLTANGDNVLSAGSQYVLKHNSADIKVQVAPTEYVTINNVGKDIFGGMYTETRSAGNAAQFGSTSVYSMLNTVNVGSNAGSNIFETVGKLIGYLETNNAEGVQNALDEIDSAMSHLGNMMADVGGRENRLTSAASVLTALKLNEQSRLSEVEDADLVDLLTNLTNQQLVYQTLLKTTSQIMQMSLASYL